jgi:hypothetical protein
MPDPKWSDDHFLNELQQQSDALADQTVRRLVEDRGIQGIGTLFQVMRTGDAQIPADAPAPIREFIEQTGELPANADYARLSGQDSLLLFGPASLMVMLASSMTRGYAAPRLCDILTISDDLGTHPYKRLMGVLQLLVNLQGENAFAPGGIAILSAQKMRLLHAGIRYVTAQHRPGYREKFGVPVNHEDMLSTLMGFSYLVLEGMHSMHLKISPQQAEDRYYRWRIFAQLIGIHPPGKPDDPSWIPTDYAEAALFFNSYARRHFTGPDQNPAGVRLAQVNLDLMVSLIPKWLRRLGLGILPRLAMTDLMTAEDLARVGMTPVTGHGFVRGSSRVLLFLLHGMIRRLPPDLLLMLSDVMCNQLIRIGRGGEVEFTIPTTLSALRGPGLV